MPSSCWASASIAWAISTAIGNRDLVCVMESLTSGGSTISGADAHVDVRFTAASCVCFAVVLGVHVLANAQVTNGGVDCSTVFGLADAHVANGGVDCSTVFGLVDAHVANGGVDCSTVLAVVDAHVDNGDTVPLNFSVSASVNGVHVATSGGDTTTALELDVRVGFFTAFAVVGVHVAKGNSVASFGC